MLYGLYLSAHGARAQNTHLDIIANNLANADNVGFKQDVPSFQAYDPFDVQYGTLRNLPPGGEAITGGGDVAETRTHFETGPLQTTGNNYDLAIAGPGFFRIRDGAQEVLTRDGGFTQSAANVLVTRESGDPVLSTAGQPITLPAEATNLIVDRDGVVSVSLPGGDVQLIAQVDIVAPTSLQQLQKIGKDRFIAEGTLSSVHSETRVVQGSLEASNVNPLTETVNMIKASRAFETNMNLVRLHDDTLGKLIATVAR